MIRDRKVAITRRLWPIASFDRQLRAGVGPQLRSRCRNRRWRTGRRRAAHRKKKTGCVLLSKTDRRPSGRRRRFANPRAAF